MAQPSDREILHIDMDAFFVSVEETLDPSLKGKPVIVGGIGDPVQRYDDQSGGAEQSAVAKPHRNVSGGVRGVVAAASYTARQYGIHSAMPLATALRLCPKAIVLRGSYSVYAEYSKRIFSLLEHYSPNMESVSLDEAYLDLTGCELLHGPVFETAERIRNEIKHNVGINASIGIAENKMVAKIASDCAKPNGMLWVRRGEERAFLSTLPVERIPGVGPKSRQTLNRMGIKTIGELAKVPRATLEKNFGKWGLDLYLKARGINDSPVFQSETPRSISRETTLEQDSRDVSFLESTLSYQVDKVAAQLRETGLRARCVTLKLRYSDFTTLTRSHTFSSPVSEDHAIFKIALRLFRGVYAPGRRVRLIGVGLASLTSPGPTQTDLFETVDNGDRLYASIDRIRDKYGFDTLLRGTSINREK